MSMITQVNADKSVFDLLNVHFGEIFFGYLEPKHFAAWMSALVNKDQREDFLNKRLPNMGGPTKLWLDKLDSDLCGRLS